MIFYDLSEDRYNELFFAYGELARQYPGWTFAEVRALPAREREYFMNLILWRNRG